MGVGIESRIDETGIVLGIRQVLIVVLLLLLERAQLVLYGRISRVSVVGDERQVPADRRTTGLATNLEAVEAIATGTLVVSDRDAVPGARNTGLEGLGIRKHGPAGDHAAHGRALGSDGGVVGIEAIENDRIVDGVGPQGAPGGLIARRHA